MPSEGHTATHQKANKRGQKTWVPRTRDMESAEHAWAVDALEMLDQKGPRNAQELRAQIDEKHGILDTASKHHPTCVHNDPNRVHLNRLGFNSNVTIGKITRDGLITADLQSALTELGKEVLKMVSTSDVSIPDALRLLKRSDVERQTTSLTR